MELKHTKKLDFVLSAIRNNNDTPYQFGGLYTYLNLSHKNISEEELKRIIRKLKKEEYIQDIGVGLYQITFDGYVFEEQGGYEAKALKDVADALSLKLEQNRLKTVDAHSEGNQIRLNRLTLWLAIGTVALALIEIIKFAVWFFSSPKTL